MMYIIAIHEWMQMQLKRNSDYGRDAVTRNTITNAMRAAFLSVELKLGHLENESADMIWFWRFITPNNALKWEEGEKGGDKRLQQLLFDLCSDRWRDFYCLAIKSQHHFHLYTFGSFFMFHSRKKAYAVACKGIERHPLKQPTDPKKSRLCTIKTALAIPAN